MNHSNNSNLVELIYVSQASERLSQSETLKIISTSRKWNESHGVTGALFYRNGYFAQILEGSFESITLACDRIKRDGRHHKIVQMDSCQIEARRYPEHPLRFFGEVGLERQFPNLAYVMAKGGSSSNSLLSLIRNPS